MNSIQRYSHTYLEQPSNLEDCPRMRKRISSYYQNNIHHEKVTYGYKNNRDADRFLAKYLEQELGIHIPTSAGGFGVIYHTDNFLLQCEIKDFLDALPFIYNVTKLLSKSASDQWINFVERVFREQGTAYSIDSNGNIHPYIDKEFSQNHQAALHLLNAPRYEQVRAIYESAYGCLRSDKQDTRTAIKDIFESIETLSKLMSNKVKRLSSNEVDKTLKNICLKNIDDKDEQAFIQNMLTSLARWVDAHHTYRHGQAKEKLSPPSLDSAILSLGTGSAFLRFLLQIDQMPKELRQDPNKP